MGLRAGIALSIACTSACGVLAYSTDELTGGVGTDAGVTPQGLPDGQSSADGAPVLVDGAVVGDVGPTVPLPDAESDRRPPPAGCPSNPCTGGNVCCYVAESDDSGEFVCQPTCPEPPMDCVGPQQCGSGAPICCGSVRFGPGSVPSCPVRALSSRCSDECVTNWGLSCNVTNTMRLCHQKADCASDPQNNNCCTYTGSGVSAIVCVSDLIRDVGGLACLP